MNELERHVEKLFRHQPDTPETRELREEILSNLQAKREDLLAQGMDERAATEAAKRDIPSVDNLIDDQQPTKCGTIPHGLCANGVAPLYSLLDWHLTAAVYRVWMAG